MNNFEKEVQQIMKNAINILTSGMEARNKNREFAKPDYGSLLDAHMMVLGVIGTEAFSKSLVPGRSDESISGRLSLIASFIQGIDLCETSISEGLYAHASALLKQEMETIAAIQEYTKDKRKDRVTPNVRELKWGINAFYGELNKLAHVADKFALNQVYDMAQTGEAKPVSLTPLYNKEISRQLYGLHVGLLIQLAASMAELHKDLYGEGFTEIEYRVLYNVTQCLADEGFLGEEVSSKHDKGDVT